MPFIAHEMEYYILYYIIWNFIFDILTLSGIFAVGILYTMNKPWMDLV